MASGLLRVGICKSSFTSACRMPEFSVHDPLRVRVLAVAGTSPIGFLITLDLTGLSELAISGLRRDLADRLDVPMGSVVIHVTHTHSAPREQHLDVAKLGAILCRAARRAVRTARPARFSFVKTKVGNAFSRNRRWRSAEMGTFTIISNDRCEFRESEVYVKGYVEDELRGLGYKRHPAVPDDARLDGPVDEELSLLQFVDSRGRSMGGIVRFAAHVDQIAFRHGPILSAEYPGVLCDSLEKELGGTFLFLNGPCGDIKPYYREYSWQECRRVGRGLAQAILAARHGRPRFEKLRSVDFYVDRIHVKTRDDFEKSVTRLGAEMFELRQAEAGGGLAKYPVREARQKWYHRWLVDALMYMGCVQQKGDFGRIFADRRACNLELVAFNGRVRYLCLQDEVFSEMTRRLKSRFRTMMGLETVSLCNGAEYYLAPAHEMDEGGYEPSWSIYGRGSFDALFGAASRLVARAVAGGRTRWTADLLARQLTNAGVGEGDLLLVHAAIRSCGYVEGGTSAILDALRKAVGTSGTLVFPTFTGARENHPDNPPAFDRRRSGCWTGALPREAMKLPGAVRSFHPTHSCVAVGPRADELTREHHLSETPIDSRSPIQKLARLKGKILIIGLDLKCLTLVHSVEEVVKHPDPCFARPCRCLMIDGDRRELRDYYLHDWGVPLIDYEKYRPFLRRARAIKGLELGDSPCWLLKTDATLTVVDRMLRRWRLGRAMRSSV